LLVEAKAKAAPIFGGAAFLLLILAVLMEAGVGFHGFGAPRTYGASMHVDEVDGRAGFRGPIEANGAEVEGHARDADQSMARGGQTARIPIQGQILR
jgi:hypothetical protein